LPSSEVEHCYIEEMVNTLNPNNVLSEFLQRHDDSVQRYNDLYSTVGGNGRLDLRRGLTTDLSFRLGTEWELFQHRWHIAAISKRPKKFIAATQLEMNDALKKASVKQLLEAIRPGSTTMPSQLTAERIEAILDPTGFNVTFSTQESWAKAASDQLDPLFADRVRAIVGSPEDSCVLDLLRSLRNVIAHASTSSMNVLNDTVRERGTSDTIGLAGETNTSLVRTGSKRIADAASYLHTWNDVTGMRRIGFLAYRVRAIAERLRVTAV